MLYHQRYDRTNPYFGGDFCRMQAEPHPAKKTQKKTHGAMQATNYQEEEEGGVKLQPVER